jgi:hypothetical protein
VAAQKPSKLLGRVRFPSPACLPRGVAQSGSAPGWGPGGRRFKSCLPDEKSQAQNLEDRRAGAISPHKSWGSRKAVLGTRDRKRTAGKVLRSVLRFLMLRRRAMPARALPPAHRHGRSQGGMYRFVPSTESGAAAARVYYLRRRTSSRASGDQRWAHRGPTPSAPATAAAATFKR